MRYVPQLGLVGSVVGEAHDRDRVPVPLTSENLFKPNRFIHFTDWVIGHSRLAMVGFASFIALGGIAHLWQRFLGTRYNERTMNWSFWLLAVGLTLMIADLTIAGLVEAQVWESSAPWIDSVRAVASYWLVRTFSGLPILAGFVLFWISLITGPQALAESAPAASLEIQKMSRHSMLTLRLRTVLPLPVDLAMFMPSSSARSRFLRPFVSCSCDPSGKRTGR